MRKTWDHPRSRGEYLLWKFQNFEPPGSSPLSRGIPQPCRAQLLHTGIIPALAGNTCWRTLQAGFSEDHPRSRGEYGGIHFTETVWCGSSPLSRGIRGWDATPSITAGIIPALAGNTCYRYTPHAERTDHPRSRGEYDVFSLPTGVRIGSSPLSRGIRGSVDRRRARSRIIPALAGNTSTKKNDRQDTWDHPRSRGEYVPSPLAP